MPSRRRGSSLWLPLFAARRHRPREHGPPRILEGRLSMGYRTLSPAQQGTLAERKRVTHVPGLQCHPCPRLRTGGGVRVEGCGWRCGWSGPGCGWKVEVASTTRRGARGRMLPHVPRRAPDRSVPGAGVEPARSSMLLGVLSSLCLPFHHPGIHGVGVSKGRAGRTWGARCRGHYLILISGLTVLFPS